MLQISKALTSRAGLLYALSTYVLLRISGNVLDIVPMLRAADALFTLVIMNLVFRFLVLPRILKDQQGPPPEK